MELNWKKTWMVLGLILVLGFGMRVYHLGNNAFVADEFLDMNSAYGYFKTGEWKAWDFNSGQSSQVNINEARDERANIYKWQVAELFRVLPPTEATARSVSVFWGVVSMLVVFWSTLVFTKRKEVALIATFLFAVSVAGIIFDRRLRMYAMFFPAYLAFATTVYQALELEYRGRMKALRMLWEKTGIHGCYALLTALLGSISLLVHQLSAVMAFSLAAYLLVQAVLAYRETKSVKNKYAVLFGLGMLSVGGLALVVPQFVRSFAAGLIWFDDHYSYIGYVLQDFAHPLLGVLLMVYGVHYLGIQMKDKKAAWYVTLSFLVPLALAIWFFHRNAGPQYIYFAQSFGLILAALGMWRIWTAVSEKFPEWGKRGMYTALVFLFLLIPNYGYFLEENNTYHETSSGGNPNYRKVFTFFKKERLASDVLVTRNFRNYYFSGANVRIFDLGDEIDRSRMTVNQFLLIRESNPTGWVILSDNDMNDYISKDLRMYFERNLERVSNDQVRGSVFVYTWR